MGYSESQANPPLGCVSPASVRVDAGTSLRNIKGFPSRQTLPIALGCVKQHPHGPRLCGSFREARILWRWSVLSQAPQLGASSDSGNPPCFSCPTSPFSQSLPQRRCPPLLHAHPLCDHHQSCLCLLPACNTFCKGWGLHPWCLSVSIPSCAFLAVAGNKDISARKNHNFLTIFKILFFFSAEPFTPQHPLSGCHLEVRLSMLFSLLPQLCCSQSLSAWK